MLTSLHKKNNVQLLLGLGMGTVFGFLLQKGGVTNYDVILGQLLFTDFTVLKIMLTAVVTGMLGAYLLERIGLVQLHIKTGSAGSNIIGGLIFGVGFAVLGYCPGTVVAAAGQGKLDAMFAGIPGAIFGAMLFARAFAKLQSGILNSGNFGRATIPGVLKVKASLLIPPLCAIIIGVLILLEKKGL